MNSIESNKFMLDHSDYMIELTNHIIHLCKQNNEKSIIRNYNTAITYIKNYKQVRVGSLYTSLNIDSYKFLKQYSKWLDAKCKGNIDVNVKLLNDKIKMAIKEDTAKFEFVVDVASVMDPSNGFPLMFLNHKTQKTEKLQNLITRNIPISIVETSANNYNELEKNKTRIKITIEYADDLDLNTEELELNVQDYYAKEVIRNQVKNLMENPIKVIDTDLEKRNRKTKEGLDFDSPIKKKKKK